MKVEERFLSSCPKNQWDKQYKSKYYKIKTKYNSKKRDIFFREIVKILDKNFNGQFFLSTGTLLGYVRNDDFIDWDDNIDLTFYLKKDSLNEIKKLQKIFINKKFISRIFKKKNYLKLTNYKYGYKLDFFSAYRDKKFYYSNWLKIPISCCKKLKKTKFKSTKVHIPLKSKEYLSHLYGNWKIKKKRGYEQFKSLRVSTYNISALRYFISIGLHKLINIIFIRYD